MPQARGEYEKNNVHGLISFFMSWQTITTSFFASTSLPSATASLRIEIWEPGHAFSIDCMCQNSKSSRPQSHGNKQTQQDRLHPEWHLNNADESLCWNHAICTPVPFVKIKGLQPNFTCYDDDYPHMAKMTRPFKNRAHYIVPALATWAVRADSETCTDLHSKVCYLFSIPT